MEKETEKPKAKPSKRIEKKEHKPTEIDATSIVRIASTDISGEFSLYHGLTKIKGISWSFSNVICKSLNLDKKRKIGSLTSAEIEKIINFIKNPTVKPFLFNRKLEPSSGQSRHIITSELELQKEFDIRNMKKIRSYKGWRHALGQPVRGQRTRSHFRKGRSMGVQKAKTGPKTAKK